MLALLYKEHDNEHWSWILVLYSTLLKCNANLSPATKGQVAAAGRIIYSGKDTVPILSPPALGADRSRQWAHAHARKHEAWRTQCSHAILDHGLATAALVDGDDGWIHIGYCEVSCMDDSLSGPSWASLAD